MKKPIAALYSLFILGFFTACDNENRVDISSVKIPELPVLRLEDDLFRLRDGDFVKGTDAMHKKYGTWYEHYVMSFLNRGGTRDSLYKPATLSFINDPDVMGAYRQVRRIYTKQRMDVISADLNDMVKRFHVYFPDRPLPTRYVTCITGWNYQFAYMDSTLVSGLDMYLGDTSMYYKMLAYPQYQVRRMNYYHLLPDIARGWMLTEFDKQDPENILLHHTIFYGKLFYAVKALLPDVNDSLIIGYTSQQMDYCREYERKLWGFLASENRLFENNLNTVREFTTEGPFTAAISKDCPPRIAMWVGWQIVRSYMKRHEEMSLSELMAANDAQKILNESRYRP